MQTIDIEIKYTVPAQFPDAGSTVAGTTSYTSYTSLDEMSKELGEQETYRLAKKQYKIEVQNTARVKLQSENGHSVRAPQTEEAKSEAKKQRTENKAILEALKAKGLSLDDVNNM